MKIQHSWKQSTVSSLLAAASLLLMSGCNGQEELTPIKHHQDELSRLRSIAILPFLDAPGPMAKGSGNVVVNAITTQMYRCRGIKVIERSRVAAIMDERDLQISQLDTDVAAKIGKLADADAVLLGSLTQYGVQKEYSHGAVYAISAGSTKHIHRVGVSLRVVDVDTGEVLYSEDAGGKDIEGFSEAAKMAAGKALKPLRDFYEVTRGSKGN